MRRLTQSSSSVRMHVHCLHLPLPLLTLSSRALMLFPKPVAWPHRKVLNAAQRNETDSIKGALLQAAQAAGADVLDLAVLVTETLRRWRMPWTIGLKSGFESGTGRRGALGRPLVALSADSLSAFYAQNGLDVVHPNRQGHLLIAAAAARFINDQLARLAPATDLVEPITAVLSQKPRKPHGAIGQRRRSPRGEVQIDESPDAPWEACYEADQLPVANLGGWAHASDASKGVSKRSLISRAPNQTVLLGPLPMPRSGGSCSLSVVHLGYVLSSYSSASSLNGDLKLGCEGCNCSSIAGSFSAEHRPFPLVPTRMNAQATNGTFFASLNASVRASTSFWVQQQAGSACYLSVRHQAPPVAAYQPMRSDQGSISQVQVTSLALREGSSSDVVG